MKDGLTTIYYIGIRLDLILGEKPKQIYFICNRFFFNIEMFSTLYKECALESTEKIFL